jgi:putative SOS response-associated peptidase YedK
MRPMMRCRCDSRGSLPIITATMCYSARIQADYRRYLREYGAGVTLREFYEIFFRRLSDSKLKIPKALEDAFAEPQNDDERAIRAQIETFHAAERTRLEQEIFKQRKRLADAERTLQSRPTKAATESRRIAGSKVDGALVKLSDLRRREWQPDDSRIFPGWYAPVLVMEDGRRVVKPMRYQCRLAGKPASHDVKFPGTYNARRDNLGGFWRELFGFSHGILVAPAFFENVAREDGNVVLEFSPRPRHDMLVACLWSRWSAPAEPDLLSFAAITDDPPPEIAQAGHDRCVIPIRPEHIDAWLQPDPADLATQRRILADRADLCYEHRLAA